MTWVQTSAGRVFDLASPDHGDVSLAVLAHELANQCRFHGATRRHYSVAQHSVLVSLAMLEASGGDRVAALVGLLHDAHEAYLGDWPTPAVVLLDQLQPGARAAVAQMKARIDEAVYAWAQVPADVVAAHAPMVKQFDGLLLFWERDRFLGQAPRAWPDEPAVKLDLGHLGSPLLEALSAPTAEATFAAWLGLLAPALRANTIPWPPARVTSALHAALAPYERRTIGGGA